MERGARLYHETIKRDYLLFDATSSLFKKIAGHNKLLYYVLCARHPFKNSTPFPIAELVSSNHSINGIAQLFLTFLDSYNKIVKYTYTPKIIITDWSTAIIGAILMAYNRMTTREYLNECLKYLTKKVKVIFYQNC